MKFALFALGVVVAASAMAAVLGHRTIRGAPIGTAPAGRGTSVLSADENARGLLAAPAPIAGPIRHTIRARVAEQNPCDCALVV